MMELSGGERISICLAVLTQWQSVTDRDGQTELLSRMNADGRAIKMHMILDC